MHGQTGPLSRGPRSHSTAPGGLGPSRDTCAHWTPAWSQGPLGMSPGGSAGRVGSGFQMGRSQGALEADLSSGHPLRPYDHQNMDPHRPGHLPGATWVVGERTGPQPPGWLLPLAVGGPWVHSANVLSLNPPQAAQWRGRLFPGHGERGDTWGHRRHSGCGAEGNWASPHCPAVSFLHLDSQPLWMALPLPSCSAPAPAPRPGAPSLPLWPWPQSAVCASQRRDWLRRGLKPPPQRQEPGRRFVPAETLPPAPVRTHAGARWSPQNPVSADTASAQLSPPRPGVQPRGGRGEPEHRAGGSGGDPLRFQDSHWTFKGRTPAGQWLMVVGPAPRSQASTERRRQAGLDPRAGLEEPQPQWPPQGPSPPSPEAPASTAGTGDQQRPCPQSVSSLTPPKGIPALSPQTPWEALPGVYPWPARLLSQDTPGWAPLTPPGMPSLSPQGGP